MQSLAKRGFYQLLQHCQQGRLVVRENNQEQIFGQGEVSANLEIRHPNMYKRALLSGANGFAESYIQGEWETESLTDLFTFVMNNPQLSQQITSGMAKIFEPIKKLMLHFSPNTIQKAKRDIIAHYDLSNEFFELFLDRDNMMYSSAIFDEHHQSLESASSHKLNTICQKLELSEKDHLLEVGSGWGGMAIYAAQHYGCRITTVTISDAQFTYAKRKIADLGLADKITILNRDYRLLEGEFDKIVSIEMIEAVGYQDFPTYFKKLNNCLKDGGKLLIQAITIRDQAYERAKKEKDFIKSYIFPGGCLPSIEVISTMITDVTDLVWCDLQDITEDYVTTLAIWQQRFTNAIPEIKKLGFNDEFIRCWQYYFSYCQAGFKTRHIGDVQLLWQKVPQS